MSVRVSSLVWDSDFPTMSAKIIALKLADNSNDEGDSIYPAKNTIARMTGCSRSTVHVVMAMFVECGLLTIVEQGGKGPKDTTHYAFDMDLLRHLSCGNAVFAPAENKGPESGPLGEKGSDGWTLRVQPLDDKGPAIGPKPSKNRKEPYAQARAPEGAPAFALQQKGKKGLGREEHPPATTTASIWIKPGTPQWSAWLAHEQTRAKSEWPVMRGKDQWLVPSPFPPVEKVRT